MPHYRSINIALHSQFDIETFPEYKPPPREHDLASGITGFVPDYVNAIASTCSVYIPVLPGSIFWIGYSVSPPVPEGQYFLFKLYIDGAHIVSWSTGKEENWKGKTMFGLFESPGDGKGKRTVEKRMLCFTAPDKISSNWASASSIMDEKACIEIKVHRATSRRRVEREMRVYDKTSHVQNPSGIDLINAGRAGPRQPKRFYEFALIDPIDQPFARFRYYYRTWEQLRDLGLLDDECVSIGEENDLSVIEPEDDIPGEPDERASNGSNSDTRRDMTEMSPQRCVSAPAEMGGLERSEEPRAYIPSGAPIVKTSTSTESSFDTPALERASFVRAPSHSYHLSLSSPVMLNSPEVASTARPKLSQGLDLGAHTEDPAPTLLMERRTGHGLAPWSLTNVISSIWRRPNIHASGISNSSVGGDGTRGAS